VLALLAVRSWADERAGGIAQARSYFQAGVTAYDDGKYEVALREFQHAHALSHSAALYFNMAACEEHLDHFQAAGLLLRQYLIEKPEAEDRANVEQRIKALEDRDERLHRPETGSAAAPTSASPQNVTPPPATKKPRLKYTWIAVGATAALGVAAIATGSYAAVHHDSLKNSCGATAGGCSSSQIDGLRAATLATDILIGVGAAAAIATVVVAVLESRRQRGERATRPAKVAWSGQGVSF
jgi:tetratricopeptide (TPR) repeat protein